MLLFLIAFVGAAIIALVLWKAMNASRSEAPPLSRRPPQGAGRPRASGPDDDPDFLREISRRTRRDDGSSA